LEIKKSKQLYREATRHLVGGVNSPVRAFKAVGGTPRFMDRAEGPYITDVDDNTYIDFVGSWGPMILGHTPEVVTKAVEGHLKKGTSFGAPTAVEVDCAKLIKEAFPSIDQIRFTSSGTEATMSALRLARGITRRERIVKFHGGYHGHSDGLLVSAGSGATTFGVPSSAGVPESLAKNTWVLPFNDTSACEELFRTQGINVAAVIIEPVCGNMGVVAPQPGFLKKLRKLTKQFGAVLIFDEVMTGFRLAWGGAQSLYSVAPDLTCLGKIIGGGFPVGAFGGPKAWMEQLAPLGPVYQAGTLSGNPMAMTAGLSTLKSLKANKPYALLEKRTKSLVQSIRKSAHKNKIQIQINQVGSMFTVFFNDHKVSDYFSATLSDTKKYGKFFHGLLEENIYLPPSQFEAAFVSVAHDEDVLEKAKQAFDKVLSKLSSSL